MSTSIEGSDIYKLNKNAGGEAVELKAETVSVLKKGIEYLNITGGTFNIGIGSLIELWGIGKDWQKVPSESEILQAKAHIDLVNLKIDNTMVSVKDPGMLIDLGGIAKGYAVDEAVRVLRENGISSGFVNMGGDVYALGRKPDGSAWNVGIQNPEIGVGGVIAKIELVDQSIVTSGDYERYFIENDIHYHHILDPATGYPTSNELSSVTIISEKSIDGDALSTAVFVMGLEEGLSFIEGMENIEAVLVTKGKKVYTTSGMVGKVEILDASYELQNK
jgi:thiamine biosynthesis lipoprotein